MESKIEALERLGQLLDDERITALEYQRMKDDLLGESPPPSEPAVGVHQDQTQPQSKSEDADVQTVPNPEELVLGTSQGGTFNSLRDLVFVALLANMVYWALEATLGFGMTSESLREAFWGTEPLPEWMLTLEDWYPLLLIGTAGPFIAWSFKAHTHLRLLGRQGIRHGHHETVWWWLIPIANFFMPYRVVFETVRGTVAPLGEPRWNSGPVPRVVYVWAWGFVGGLILAYGSRNMVSSATTLGEIQAFGGLYGLGCLALAVAAGAGSLMVKQLSEGQRVRMQELIRKRNRVEGP